LGRVVKKIASSDIGRIALTIAAVYFMGPAGLNLAGPTGLIGVSNAALATGINAFAGSTLVNLASGQKLGDAVKNGAISGVLAGVGTGVVKGFDATLPGAPVTPGTGVEVNALGGTGGTTVNSIAPVSEAAIGAPTLADQTANLSLDQQALYNQINTPANVAVAPGVNVASAPLSTGTLTDATSSYAGSIQNLPLPEDFVRSGIPVDAQEFAYTIGNPHAVVPPAYTNYIPGTPAEAALRIAPPSNVPYNLTSDYMNLVDPAQVGGGAPLPADVVYKDALAGQATQPGFVDTIKQGYNEYIRPYTPGGITESGKATALQAYNDTLAATKSQKLAEAAYEKALPGVFSTYGPAAAVGLGAAYLGGAFTPEEPGSPNLAPKETGTDLLRAQPGVYGTTPGGANVTYASLPSGYNYNPMQMLYRPQVTMGNPYGNIYGQRRMFAEGGIASVAPRRYATGGYAKGGIGSMANFPRKTGPINGPGTGTSDDIPAMLSDGEFVMTAKAVRGAGKGSRREGARRMYAMMRKLERNA